MLQSRIKQNSERAGHEMEEELLREIQLVIWLIWGREEERNIKDTKR